MTIKNDDRTGVRATPFRDASQEIVEVRASIAALEEERRAQTSALYDHQSNHDYLLNSTVPWCVALAGFVVALTCLHSIFTLPALLIILALVGLYTIAGIKSIYLGYGLDKTTHALRYRLSRICASERAQLTSGLISMAIFTILGNAFSSLGITILMWILPTIQMAVAVNFGRWRLALKDLRELDDIEHKHEKIHHLRKQLRELEEGVSTPQVQPDVDKEVPELVRVRGGPF